MGRPLTVADAARQLGGISRARVIQLDPQLRPRRAELGVRIYDQERLDELEAERMTRASERAARSHRKEGWRP